VHFQRCQAVAASCRCNTTGIEAEHACDVMINRVYAHYWQQGLGQAGKLPVYTHVRAWHACNFFTLGALVVRRASWLLSMNTRACRYHVQQLKRIM
jgi:hypothetical protein